MFPVINILTYFDFLAMVHRNAQHNACHSAVLQYTRFVRDGTSVSIFAEAVETKDPVRTEKFAHFDGWGAIQSYRARAKRELNKRVSKRGGLCRLKSTWMMIEVVSVMDGLGSEMTM
jgi:hypothetical protein